MKRSIRFVLIISLLFFGTSVSYSQGTQISFGSIPKSGTVLIYSHMDDDLIWMLPFWEITEKFIGGAMPATPTFEKVVREQQIFLNNNGQNIPYESNWITPWSNISQQQYDQYYWDNNQSYNYLANDHLVAFWDNSDNYLVRREINKIKAKLEQYIADPGMRRAITHNNWGEYGHQHHRAVNTAVRELAVKYRKDVWMLGCDNGAFRDVYVPNGITYTLGSFNKPGLYTGIRSIYRNNYCWSWTDYVPSGDHKFIRIVENGSDKSNILKGDAITYTGPSQMESGAFIFDGSDDYMTLEGNNNSSFTITMRFRPEEIRAMDISAMSEYPGSGRNDRNIFMTGDGRISARINDGTSRIITSSSSVSADAWTFVAITGDGSSFKLYLNGLLERTTSSGTAITNYSTPELILGQAIMTGTYFNGQVNDVRFFSRALSESEIAGMSNISYYTINADAGSGGTISPSGNRTVSAGANLTFTIRPSTGYRIAAVRVDDVSAGAISSYTFSNVSRNHTIYATFSAIPVYTIAASAGAGGSISPSGNQDVSEGSDRTFTITPATGYRISDVLVDGASAGPVSAYTFNDVDDDHSISARFSPRTFTLTGNAGPYGSIDPEGATTVNYGAGQSFSIIPNTGYRISDVLVDDVSVGTPGSYSINNIHGNHTISAEFSVITFTLTASAGSGGAISPGGNRIVNYGTSQTFSITPGEGYYISDVRVDDVSIGPVSSYTFSNIISDHTISASFAHITYTISGGAGAGGTINPSGPAVINHGSNATYLITPDEGFLISDVLVDNASVGKVTSFTFNRIVSNHTISATFTPIILTIEATSKSRGTISPSGNSSVIYGTDLVFSILPDVGYEIEDVIVDGKSAGPVSTWSFTRITRDHSISASFKIITFTITSNSGTGGSIGPEGDIPVTYGSDQEFIITPDSIYKILDVKADGISVGPVSSWSFDDVVSDHSISATFKLKEIYSIVVSVWEGGSISPWGSRKVMEGSDVTYRITPYPGHRIYEVVVDRKSVGVVKEYTFAAMASDHTISVSFASNIQVEAYPNPFTDVLNISIVNPWEKFFDIEISNMAGRIIHTQTRVPGNSVTPLHIQGSPGMYFLRIYQEKTKVFSMKIIKY